MLYTTNFARNDDHMFSQTIRTYVHHMIVCLEWDVKPPTNKQSYDYHMFELRCENIYSTSKNICLT